MSGILYLVPAAYLRTQIVLYFMKYKRELSTPCFSNCTLALVKHSTHPIKQSSPDLGSLGVQSDGNAGVHSVLLFVHLVGNPDVVDGFSMILVRSRKCKELTGRHQ